MDKCDNCGNEYENPFQVLKDGKQFTFDSFECAINILAPRCAQCDTRIIGHGVEEGDKIYCCARCAKAAGVEGLVDHLD